MDLDTDPGVSSRREAVRSTFQCVLHLENEPVLPAR